MTRQGPTEESHKAQPGSVIIKRWKSLCSVVFTLFPPPYAAFVLINQTVILSQYPTAGFEKKYSRCSSKDKPARQICSIQHWHNLKTKNCRVLSLQR